MTSKNPKNYTRNRFAAKDLANRIQGWYTSRGFNKVKVWVEEDRSFAEDGSRLPPNYFIRSNIIFNVDKINSGLIE